MRKNIITTSVFLLFTLLSPIVAAYETSRSEVQLCSPDQIALGDILTVKIPYQALDELAARSMSMDQVYSCQYSRSQVNTGSIFPITSKRNQRIHYISNA
jgi:hypothetical protein